MKLYLLKHSDGRITTSSHAITEDGVSSIMFETTLSDIEAVQEGVADWDIQDGQLAVIASDRKAKQEQALLDAEKAKQAAAARKLALVELVTSGTATLEERMEFANLL